MKSKPKPIQTTRIVRVSQQAKEHLEKVVDNRRAQGLSASGSAILNELIFSLPLHQNQEGK